MKQMQAHCRVLLLLPHAQKRLNGFQFLELVVAYRNVHSLAPPFNDIFLSATFYHKSRRLSSGGLHFIPQKPTFRAASSKTPGCGAILKG